MEVVLPPLQMFPLFYSKNLMMGPNENIRHFGILNFVAPRVIILVQDLNQRRFRIKKGSSILHVIELVYK